MQSPLALLIEAAIVRIATHAATQRTKGYTNISQLALGLLVFSTWREWYTPAVHLAWRVCRQVPIEFSSGCPKLITTSVNRTADMKSRDKALLIFVALVFGGSASQTLASQSYPITSDHRGECVAEERSDCAERCLTEHNCCIKSCNWVEPKAKSVCIKHCKSILKKCNQECNKKPEAEKTTESRPGA